MMEFTPCPDLPLDILINHVFVELSVRSLARCRCVCKPWLRALSEPEFPRLHHNRQLQKPRNRKILCGPKYIKKHEAFCFYSVDLESSSGTDGTDVMSVLRLRGFPLQQTNYRVCRTLDYSNGMVCLISTCKNGGIERHLLFGNPSTGVYNILPDPIIGRLFGGFGYDSSSDDYKFVRVVDGMTHIFSLKSKSWRIIGYSPSGIDVDVGKLGCFFDGSIYWMVECTSNIMILSFDLKDEVFQELPPLPHPLVDIILSRISIKVVGGSVCIIKNRCLLSNEVVMWSLFNQGETYSWKKLINVTFQYPTTWLLDPICFTEDGKILFFMWNVSEETCYIVVDPKTKKIEGFTIPNLSHKLLKEYCFQDHLSGYIDTLVSPY